MCERRRVVFSAAEYGDPLAAQNDEVHFSGGVSGDK